MACSSPSTLKFLNMNIGDNKRKTYNVDTQKDERVTVHADERKNTLKTILEGECPQLVFIQEFTWVDLHHKAFKEMMIPKHYSYCGNEHSGFIFDNRLLDCQRLDRKTSIQRTHRYGASQQGAAKYDFDLDRLCLSKIKSKAVPQFEILAACWHGPSFKINDELKKAQLDSLLNFLLSIKAECGNLPLIIGGDFNLESKKVEEVCIVLRLQIWAPPDTIMIWIPTFDFIQMFIVRENTKHKQYEALDHLTLIMKSRLSTNTENLKALVIKTRYKDEPVVTETEWFKYELYITTTQTESTKELISVSWHGDYDEYSDEAKKSSIIWTLRFLVLECDRIRYDKIKLESQVELDLKWVLTDVPITENIHCRDIVLDTWILSNNLDFLSKAKDEKLRLEPIKLDLPPLTPQGNRSIPNPSPVDIHLDIVNVGLKCSGKHICTLNGYLKRCIYLQKDVQSRLKNKKP